MSDGTAMRWRWSGSASTHSRSRLVAAGTAAALLSLATPASAFKAEGHEAIEAEAYAELVADPQGLQIVQRLVSDGYLDVQSGVHLATCVAQKGSSCVVADSGDVDADLVLQTGQAGQCAHFMAGTEDDMRGNGQALAYMLGYAAVPRCRRYLDRLVYKALDHPRSSAGRDAVRALIHSVVDSYSDAHVARVPGPDERCATAEEWEHSKIIRLKVWRLVAPYRWPEQPFREEREHAISDPRDDAYVDERYIDSHSGDIDAACKPARHLERPVPERCLSSRARGAVLATKELLRALDDLRRGKQDDATRMKRWTAYLDDHFALDPSANDRARLEALNASQRQLHKAEWDFDRACRGDCFGKCPSWPDTLRAQPDIVMNPRCERDFERHTLRSSKLWAISEGSFLDGYRGIEGVTVTTGLRLYPSLPSVNAWLAGHLPLQWSPYVELDAGELVPLKIEPGLRATPLARARLALFSFVFHPGAALSLFGLYGDLALRDRFVIGTRILELSLRPSGLTYKAGQGWHVGFGVGTLHSTSDLQPWVANGSLSFSVGYGSWNHDL
jgi:hypothetical protein